MITAAVTLSQINKFDKDHRYYSNNEDKSTTLPLYPTLTCTQRESQDVRPGLSTK